MKNTQLLLRWHLQVWYLVPFQEFTGVERTFTATWLFLTIRASW